MKRFEALWSDWKHSEPHSLGLEVCWDWSGLATTMQCASRPTAVINGPLKPANNRGPAFIASDETMIQQGPGL